MSTNTPSHGSRTALDASGSLFQVLTAGALVIAGVNYCLAPKPNTVEESLKATTAMKDETRNAVTNVMNIDSDSDDVIEKKPNVDLAGETNEISSRTE